MKPLSFAAAAGRVFDIGVGQLLWSRRTIFMGLVVGGPVALAAVFRALDAAGLSAFRVNGESVGGPAMFGGFVWLLYLRFSIPVLGAFYGTSLVSDEVESRTITYLFTRPIRRGAILIGKYLAYIVCTGLIVLPSIVLVFLLVVPIGGGSIGEQFPSLLLDMGILLLGLAVYGAVFALVGARVPRPLVAGLILVFGWEQLAMIIPGYVRNFTVAYYLQALVPHAMPKDDAMAAVQSLFMEPPPAGSSVLWLMAITAGALWLGARTLEHREYILEQ